LSGVSEYFKKTGEVDIEVLELLSAHIQNTFMFTFVARVDEYASRTLSNASQRFTWDYRLVVILLVILCGNLLALFWQKKMSLNVAIKRTKYYDLIFRVPHKEVKALIRRSEKMLSYCEVSSLECHSAAKVCLWRMRFLDFFGRGEFLR